MLKCAIETAKGRIPVVSGVAEMSTRAAIQYMQDGEQLGAAGFMVMPPMVYKSDPRETEHWFRTLAKATPLPGLADDEQGLLGGEAPDPLRSTVSVYIVVPDPDAHFARAKAEGAASKPRLHSAAAGGVILRVVVERNASLFAGATPQIAGLTPLSRYVDGTRTVALVGLGNRGGAGD
mgnify:CR=1 FL=1